MNRLEETKQKLQDKFAETGIAQDWEKGFDAAIALDLPVKFAEWRDTLPRSGDKDDDYPYLSLPTGEFLLETLELYKYWIDNIYKP